MESEKNEIIQHFEEEFATLRKQLVLSVEEKEAMKTENEEHLR